MKMILAVDLQNAIGYVGNAKLPWYIPQDLKRFKELTSNSSVIMGHNTFQSLESYLPNRTHFIVSASNYHKLNYFPNVSIPCRTFEEAMEKANKNGKEVWCIGGASIYNYALSKNYIDEIYLTRVKITLPDVKPLAIVNLNLDNFKKISEIMLLPIGSKKSEVAFETYHKVEANVKI